MATSPTPDAVGHFKVERNETELRRAIFEGLDDVVDPCSAANGTNFSVLKMGMVKDVAIDLERGFVGVKLRLTSPGCLMLQYFDDEIPLRLKQIEGVNAVEVETDAGFEWDSDMMDRESHARYAAALRRGLPMAR